MTPEIENLRVDFHGYLHDLGECLRLLRECDKHVAIMEDSLAELRRDCQRLEDAAVLQETRKDGAINGTNEQTRKPQIASLLQTLRKQPDHPIHEANDKVETLEIGVDEFRWKAAEYKDQVMLTKYQLDHINALLYALK